LKEIELELKIIDMSTPTRDLEDATLGKEDAKVFRDRIGVK